MEISLRTITDIVTLFCIGMSFVCFKIIPVERHAFMFANDKHIKLTILGAIFLPLAFIIGLINLTVDLFR